MLKAIERLLGLRAYKLFWVKAMRQNDAVARSMKGPDREDYHRVYLIGQMMHVRMSPLRFWLKWYPSWLFFKFRLRFYQLSRRIPHFWPVVKKIQ